MNHAKSGICFPNFLFPSFFNLISHITLDRLVNSKKWWILPLIPLTHPYNLFQEYDSAQQFFLLFVFWLLGEA